MIVFGKEESMKLTVVACCVILLTLFVAAPAQAAYNEGDPVADFTLNDASGTPVSLSDFEGMVVLVTFWADW